MGKNEYFIDVMPNIFPGMCEGCQVAQLILATLHARGTSYLQGRTVLRNGSILAIVQCQTPPDQDKETMMISGSVRTLPMTSFLYRSYYTPSEKKECPGRKAI